MKFDTLIKVPCALPSMSEPGCSDDSAQAPSQSVDCNDPDYRVTHTDCPDAPDCNDQSFAQANPALCLTTQRLILKPGFSYVEPRKSVRFRAYLWQDGVETLLEDNLTFNVSNPTLAIIGVRSGSLTGITAGILTVTVEYAGMYAYAQVEVTETCSITSNAFAIIIDASKSMKGTFSPTGGTKIGFAKRMAVEFVDCIDFEKDTAAVLSFDNDATLKQVLTEQELFVKTAINGIAATTDKTIVASGLAGAKLHFDNLGIPYANRVYVLFTDGENKSGINPVTLADSIKESGSTIIVAGIRAYGIGFRQLEAIANGGFFVNATPANEASVATWLNGTKSYLCSGECQPDGGVAMTSGSLDFTNLLKWDVTSGYVDLIGSGGVGALFDVVPGHGLYLDMAGSNAADAGNLATILSKRSFIWTNGSSYRLTFKLAGNNRENRADDTMRVRVLGAAGAMSTQSYSIAYDDDFTTYTINFTAGASDVSGKIEFSQIALGETSGQGWFYGCLLDDIVLQNLTAGTIVFADDFNDENRLVIPPRCGDVTVYWSTALNPYQPQPDCSFGEGTICTYGDGGYVQVSGYDCNYACGCLADDAIAAQSPDEHPGIDLEDDAPPTVTIYTSTRTYTASCPGGTTGSDVTETAVSTSEISQEDADAKALAAATAAATAALVCEGTFDIGDLLNIRFWLAAPFGSLTQAQIDADRKAGYAAIGNGPTDFWNQTGREAADDVNASVHNPLYLSDGSLVDVTLQTDFKGIGGHVLTYVRQEHPDALMRWYVMPENGNQGVTDTYRDFTFYDLPVGTYDVYVFGHGADDADTCKIEFYVGAALQGTLETANSAAWIDPVFTNGDQYIATAGLIVTNITTTRIRVRVILGASGICLLSGIQIKRIS